jgi:hypothetical protein
MAFLSSTGLSTFKFNILGKKKRILNLGKFGFFFSKTFFFEYSPKFLGSPGGPRKGLNCFLLRVWVYLDVVRLDGGGNREEVEGNYSQGREGGRGREEVEIKKGREKGGRGKRWDAIPCSNLSLSLANRKPFGTF